MREQGELDALKKEHLKLTAKYTTLKNIFDSPALLKEHAAKAKALPSEKLMGTSIFDLDLSVRAINGLRMANIRTAGDIILRSRNELMQIPNFGKKSLGEVERTLKKMGVKW